LCWFKLIYRASVVVVVVVVGATVVVVVVVGSTVVVVVVVGATVVVVVVVKLLFKSQSWQDIPSSCLAICHNKFSVVPQPIPLLGIGILISFI
jgi:hypothetical protein